MEFNKVEDLFQYRESLEDLYKEERFQPLVQILSKMKDGAEEALFTTDLISVKPEERELRMVQNITTRNVLMRVIHLPKWIKEMEKALEEKKKAIERMSKSQEGGEI